ncbi:MAG: protein kinase [Pirellulaceae bacterium]
MSQPALSDARTELDLSGRRLGDYQLLRRLGRGGMAEVYLAEQISLKRQIAFKVLRGSLAGDDAYIRRFHHEAQAAANLVHANIVQIHEVGCLDGIHFIAQEYVSGQNVKQLLTRRGQGLDAPLAVSVLRQVASALHKASEQGIIHRDIKPENIMLAQTGEVKVADFGLARVASQEAMNLTQVGITMGTPLYMSPEQVEGKPVDPRSDIYSLGVTCYQMLSGQPPFDGETALAIAVQHLKTEPKRLEEVRRDLPPALCRIVHKMLAKVPADRYQRPIEILKDLRGLRIEGLEEALAEESMALGLPDDTLTIGARMAATQQLERVLSQQVKLPSRRSRWGWKAALVLAAFALGGLGASIARPKPLLELSPDEVPTVKKCDSAGQQYYYAIYEAPDTEQALLAVSGYFPPAESSENQRYSRLAQQRLGRYYLARDQLDKALAAYRELAMLAGEGELVPTFRMTGVAGEAVVYDRLVKQSADHHRRLKQEDPQRSEVKKRLTELGQETNQELIRDDLLKQEVKKLLESPEYQNQ